MIAGHTNTHTLSYYSMKPISCNHAPKQVGESVSSYLQLVYITISTVLVKDIFKEILRNINLKRINI